MDFLEQGFDFMGARGAIGQSNKVKTLTGNPGKRQTTQNNPQPDLTPPECPSWLHEYGKEKWEKLAPELVRLGLLTSVDGDIFAAYCQACAEFRLATETLAVEERVQATQTGYLAPHPALKMQKDAWSTMTKLASLFGLDPASRSRINVPGEKEEADPFEQFLGGKN